MSSKSRIASGIDTLNRRIGDGVAWLTLVMVLVTFAIVVLRYAFNFGPVWMQETVTWMHAAVFMLGGAATLQRDEHVRVDIFYRGASPRKRAWVDIAGVLLLLLPLCVFLVYVSFDYVAASWAIREGARDAGGLPYPFLPVLKSVLLVMPVMVALQGISLLLGSALAIRARDQAKP